MGTVSPTPPRKPENPVKTRRLSVESLEAKALPAMGPVTPLGISLNAYGVLNIKGDARNDTAHVWTADGEVHATLSHTTYHYVGGSKIPITVSDPEKVYTQDQVTKISFQGAEGNDAFTNDTFLPSTAAGQGGTDQLVGGWANDILIGGDGADTLEGRGGDDDLRGQAGSDTYRYTLALVSWGTDAIQEAANVNSDTLDFSALAGDITVNLGQTGVQKVRPSGLSINLSNALGIENVKGTSKDDTITGNARPNVLDGNHGDDILYGGEGNDVLHGDEGNDQLLPGAGANKVTDGAGNDYVDFHLNAVGINYTTGGGNDTVIGSLLDDKLVGSSGNDRLEGRVGYDTLTGGSGNDTLVGGFGINTLSDGPGNDVVDFSENAVGVKYTTGGGNDIVYGSDENDVLTGSSGDDELHGGMGNDRLFGKAGTDHLFGDDGADWLEAGSASEVAVGGAGQDSNAHQWAIYGATYDDVRQGGAGTCVFLSALAGGAHAGIDLESRISYLGNYTYNVQLYNPDTGNAYNQHVTFDGSISKINGKRWDPWPAQEDEYWTLLYQRAYLKMTNALGVNFKDPDYAMSAVTHRSVSTGDWDSPAFVKSMLDAGLVVTAGDADATSKVYAHHSYTVMNVYQDGGTWKIQLRNPWGVDVNWDQLAAGTKVASGTNDDGLITLTWDAFQGVHDFDRISIS
jgi:Ca2+-binding RTX toxin-like protein